MSVHILGIRHHGPGSARNVKAYLEELQPDIILVEGPPEGDALLEWLGHAEMNPPVALLAYVPDQPQKAAFYPFAEFSPEWQAIQFGLIQNLPVRFMDMPLVHKFAGIAPKAPLIDEAEAEASDESPSDGARVDPLDALAKVAGFEDGEAWWEYHIETAIHPREIFGVVKEVMAELRAQNLRPESKTEQIREAFMRKAIRKAQKEKFEKIAVICGAWHAPALERMPTQKVDNALIKGLPRVKVSCTWIPWTYERLSLASGYGAGINSPGWYEHSWKNPQDDGTQWLTRTAQVFRAHQMDISSAHIIESVRLAQSLSNLRGQAQPGLLELDESVLTVMCMGEESPMLLLQKDLVIGHKSGSIPEDSPQSPLSQDFHKKVKSYRMKLQSQDQNLKLDLRKEFDLNKSIFLHRLKVLGIDWGEMLYARGKGTFKEEWNLYWEPEMMIRLLEKANLGNSVETAAEQYLIEMAEDSDSLADVSTLLSRALLAELPQGSQALIQKMDKLASGTSDISLLMESLIPLVEIKKFGNVRNTDQETIGFILHSIFYRLLVGLLPAVQGIDQEQAQKLAGLLRNVQQALLLLDQSEYLEDWLAVLEKVIRNDASAPYIAGTACKLLYDRSFLEADRTANEFSKALSISRDAFDSAAWLEGFLKDSATILLLDDLIWNIVNDWVDQLEDDIFLEIIPLLRRTFSTYSPVEKRKLAERLENKGNLFGKKTYMEIDQERGEAVLPVLELLLGLS